MRYVIWTAISHGHIKYYITTVGSHGCIIKNCISQMELILTSSIKRSIRLMNCTYFSSLIVVLNAVLSCLKVKAHQKAGGSLNLIKFY